MSKRFIKFISSERAKWLRKNYPNAFLVLSLIAERARRVPDMPDGLQIGDCILSRSKDCIECGLTEDQFRTALEQLEKFNISPTVWTRKMKNPKICPSKIPNNCTIVRLIDSEIWDINPESNPQQNPHQIPNASPTHPHKQESKEVKEEKKNEEKQEGRDTSPSIEVDVCCSRRFSAGTREEEIKNFNHQEKVRVSEDEFENDVQIAKAACNRLQDITENFLRGQLWKYSLGYVLEQIAYVDQKKDRITASQDGYLKCALENDYAKCFQNLEPNKNFAEEMKKKNGWFWMNVDVEFSQDMETGEKFSHFMEIGKFQGVLAKIPKTEPESQFKMA